MALANVSLQDTYDLWRVRTNQLVTWVNYLDAANVITFVSNSSPLLVEGAGSVRGTVYLTINTSTNINDVSTINVAAASVVNTVYQFARTSFTNNNVAIATAYTQANAAYVQANTAYTQANIAYTQANTAYNFSNTVLITTQSAFDKANVASGEGGGALGVAVAAFTQANAAPSVANTYAVMVGTAGNTYAVAVGTAANSTSTTALALKANLASPTFTGTPTLPTGTIATTQAAGANTISVATTAFVAMAGALKANLASPTFTGTVTIPTPFTLGAVSVTPTGTELNYVDGVTSAIQTQLDAKAPLAGPTFTGTVTIPTPFTLGAVSVTPTGTELNYVDGVTSAIQTQLDAKAPLASPTFTGTPTLPTGTVATTQAAADSTTKVATTAFVTTADNLKAPLASPTFTGTVTIPTPFTLGATSVTATGTELNYVDGVTSAIQTQLDAKLASSGYTAADVLTKIKTVDGAGSGLDADLLDGLSSADFATSSHTHTFASLTSKPTTLSGYGITDGGGTTLLGTITTTSGTSLSLTGLTLTDYKSLIVVFDAVSTDNTGSELGFGSVAIISDTLGTATRIWDGIHYINLSTSGISTVQTSVWAAGRASWVSSFSRALASSMTTASTSITYYVTSGSFDAGEIRVYGVK